MFVRILMLAVVGVLLWAVFARSSEATSPAQRYVVKPGDTLWAIAERNYAGDPRAAVWTVQHRNRLTGTTLEPGQVLMLP
jgi:LysM repeat protein